ncbi:MAG: hypothetical protein KA248_15540 [Kiritimatiellae bacterium]|nr:hypothetical protein [Kiritimatiellia bacterium]
MSHISWRIALLNGLFVLSVAAPGWAAGEPVTAPAETVVFYFHRTGRCPTCLKLEAWSGEVVQGLAAGENPRAVTFKAVNLDVPENKHYEQDFQLTFSSVVAAEVQADGRAARWKNLGRIWELSGREVEFRKYLAEEIGRFLGARGPKPSP